MRKVLALTAVCMLTAGSVNALVVVNGVSGEDGDNTSPFETLQAAVEYANSNSESVVEIQTNLLPGGLLFAEQDLNGDLTIQAGAGFSPVIQDAVHFLPTNEANLVTLKDITIHTNTALAVDDPTVGALYVGCNLTAINCIFNSDWESGARNYAVSCAVPSAGTISTLTMTSCTLTGHGGLEAGRAVRDHILDNCLINAYQPTESSFEALGITNARNFRSGDKKMADGSPVDARMDTSTGFLVIDTPRTITLTDTIVRAGTPIAWPTSKENAAYNSNENNVFGPIVATNCVFDTVRNPDQQAWPSCFGASSLPETQNITCAFTHCTFRATSPEETTVTAQMKAANGLIYFPTNDLGTPTVNFTNCLFDAPSVDYLMFDVNTHTNLLGNGNTYHFFKDPLTDHHRGVIYAGGSYPARTPYESDQYDHVTAPTRSTPTFADSNGRIVIMDPAVVGHAVATVPAVTTDIHGDPRPMPGTVLLADIGADEIDETLPAEVNNWSVY